MLETIDFIGSNALQQMVGAEGFEPDRLTLSKVKSQKA